VLAPLITRFWPLNDSIVAATECATVGGVLGQILADLSLVFLRENGLCTRFWFLNICQVASVALVLTQEKVILHAHVCREDFRRVLMLVETTGDRLTHHSVQVVAMRVYRGVTANFF